MSKISLISMPTLYDDLERFYFFMKIQHQAKRSTTTAKGAPGLFGGL